MSKTIISRVYTVSKEVATAFVNAVSAKSLPVQVCVGIPFKDGNGQTATVTSDRPFVCGGEMCVRIKFGHSINGQTYSCADLTLNKQRSTLAQLIDSINLIGEDVDVYVDGIDGIAVCPPVSLTPEGRKHFSAALTLPVDGLTIVGEDADYDALYEHEDNHGDGGRLMLAWELLKSLSGQCSVSDYERWFGA